MWRMVSLFFRFSLMTGSVHAALGAAIGRFIPSAPLAFGVGLFSHFLGDIVPHHDMGPGETPLVFATMARIGQQHGFGSPRFWCALGAICPDFEHIPAELKKDPRRVDPMPEKLFPTHNGRIPHGGWPWRESLGVAMQVALFLGGLYIAGTLGASETKD